MPFNGNFLMAAPADVLVSAPILFFLLGGIMAAMRADLPLPASFAKALTAYLLIAIGLKGGATLSADEGMASWLLLLGVAAGLSLAMPVLAFMLLRACVGLDRVNAAAVAAHYGSVSLVTFLAGTRYLEAQGIEYGGYMVAALAVMEAPAIVTGLLLARTDPSAQSTSLRAALGEVATNGSIVLLVGSIAVGTIIGTEGLGKVAGLFVAPWDGALSLFLLGMGYSAVSRLRETAGLSMRLIGFGLAMPLIGALLGLAVGGALGLGHGDLLLLAVLAASASYIAVPAALQHALPAANPALSLPLALAITFPFNVLIGIPIYAQAVTAMSVP